MMCLGVNVEGLEAYIEGNECTGTVGQIHRQQPTDNHKLYAPYIPSVSCCYTNALISAAQILAAKNQSQESLYFYCSFKN